MQNIIEWLERVKDLDDLIDCKIVERDQLWSKITKLTGTIDDMPHGTGVSDPVGTGVIKLVELGDEINRLIDKYVDHKKQVNEYLKKLPNLQNIVLSKYYIQGMKIDDIASDINYSYMQTWRIKEEGIKNLIKHVIECY